MTELLKRAELLCFDAKSVGFWTQKDAEDFCVKVNNGEISEAFFDLVEEEVREVLKVLES